MTRNADTRRLLRRFTLPAFAVVLAVGVPLASASAFSLRSTQDGSRPVGVSIDRSRQPGFVDYEAMAARRADQRRLRELAEEVVRAWRSGRLDRTTQAAPAPRSVATPPARLPAGVSLPKLPAPPKIIRLDDRPRPDTRVIRGSEGRRLTYVRRLVHDNG